MKKLSIISSTEVHKKRLYEIGMFHDSLNFVMLEDDEIVGYFAAQIGDGLYYNLEANEMYLEYLTVEKKRKQGYGRRIIETIFETFQDIDRIFAETSDINEGFWQKIGTTIPEFYTDEDREIYEIVLLRKNFISFTAC